MAAGDNPYMKPLRVSLASLAIGIISLYSGAQEWSRVSPFTRVDISGDDARVVYDGVAYDLVSIEQRPTAEILAFCRKTYGRNADERFAADYAARDASEYLTLVGDTARSLFDSDAVPGGPFDMEVPALVVPGGDAEHRGARAESLRRAALADRIARRHGA